MRKKVEKRIWNIGIVIKNIPEKEKQKIIVKILSEVNI